MKHVLITCIALVMSSNVFGQNNPEQFVQNFFNDYQKEGASIAIDNLYGTNRWISRSADAVTNLKSQLEGLNEDYVGKYFGYELLVKKQITDDYVLLSYFVKFERQPIRYTFQFYRPQDNWVLFSFQYDADLDDEIEEAAKLYNMSLDY